MFGHVGTASSRHLKSVIATTDEPIAELKPEGCDIKESHEIQQVIGIGRLDYLSDRPGRFFNLGARHAMSDSKDLLRHTGTRKLSARL